MGSILKKEDIYFFDTNAIYYFCGEEAEKYDIKRFRKEMKLMPYKIVPSCVYQEMITKYRENTDELGRILTILARNDFKIAPSQYDFLGDDFTRAMDGDLSKAIDTQYRKKMDNESRLIYLIIFSISMVYTRILCVDEGIKFVDTFMKTLVTDSINPIENDKLSEIKTRLEKAYDEDNTEDEVKKTYIELCFYYCVLAKAFAFKIKNVGPDNLCNMTEVEFAAERSVSKMQKYGNDFNEYLAWFNKKHKDIVEEALDEIPKFFMEKKYTPEQCDYLKIKLEKLLLHKAKLEKNDIYDMFFLFSFSDYSVKSFNMHAKTSASKDNIKLLSFDKRAKSFIETFSPSSVLIIDSYKI